jgi:calcineurin-like phosphoesterase family protein
VSTNFFFTADTHFGHGNIIKYCTRPFRSYEEMDEAMIARCNEVVRAGDVLYHLGDVAWSSYDLNKYFGRLNTKNIHLIYGNHDREQQTKHPHIRSYAHYKDIHIDKIGVRLCHYPIQSWRGRSKGSFHLHGHCHGKLTPEGRRMDVGVDTHEFYPWEWSEIRKKLEAVPLPKFDHHGMPVDNF